MIYLPEIQKKYYWKLKIKLDSNSSYVKITKIKNIGANILN